MIDYSFCDNLGIPLSSFGTINNGRIKLKTLNGAVARLQKFKARPSDFVVIAKAGIESPRFLLDLSKGEVKLLGKGP